MYYTGWENADGKMYTCTVEKTDKLIDKQMDKWTDGRI